jgi:nitrous oxide reductase accessory protein NosL
MSLKLFILFVFSLNLYAAMPISNDVKEKKLYPMGEKIYNKKCPTLDIANYKSYDKLLHAIEKNNICTQLNKKHAEALAVYLWDKKSLSHKHYKKITVTKEDKCPVCGMYLHYYPTWVSQINYPNNETYKFDGIKDMMKFYFSNKEGIVDILVQDYYSLKTLNARDAFFVIGSDVTGPMGYELIAFSDKKKAMDFSLEHKGKKVLRFDKITEHMVRSLD